MIPPDLDDADRPRLDPLDEPATPAGRSGQHALVQVHEHLRAELDQLCQAVRSVADGQISPDAARSLINRMTMRQKYWSLGAFCAAYCRVLAIHHTIEDEHLFSTLRARDERLAPVLDRLSHEHEVIAGLLDRVDGVLSDLVGAGPDTDRVQPLLAELDRMADALLSHLAYEEEQLLGPIGRLSVIV